MGEKKSKTWMRHVQKSSTRSFSYSYLAKCSFLSRFVEFKLSYYNCLSYLFLGIQSEEGSKMGERVAYFSLASTHLSTAGKLTKHLDVADKNVIVNCLTFTSDVVNGKLDNAKKENEFVFHEKVPDADSLPELKGASLVKGLGFDITDPEISGPDIFGRIVPMEAHEASSLYRYIAILNLIFPISKHRFNFSEEKAKILRQIGDEIEDRDASLAVFMSSLELDEIPQPSDHLGLPQELIECAAAFSVKEDAIKRLTEAMGRIASISADVESEINEIEELLKVTISIRPLTL